jgi:hypothetical protein
MSISQSPDTIVLRLLSSSRLLVPSSAYNLESFGDSWRALLQTSKLLEEKANTTFDHEW